MLTLPSEMIALLAAFAPEFSKRVWELAQVLLVGTILSPHKRTVTSALRAMGLSQEKGFDAAQVVAVGYSNGANIAGSLLLLYPDLLAGAVLWRPMQPLTRDVPAVPTTRRPPVFFNPGIQDPTVDPAATERYAALLSAAGFQLTRQDTPAGHNLTQADVEAGTAWFRQHFAALAPPSQ